MATLHKIGKTIVRNTAILRAIEGTTGELAVRTGVSKRTLNRLEKARQDRRSYDPMLKTVVRLAQGAGVTLDDYVNNHLTT